MNATDLRTLEFDKIRAQLEALCASRRGKARAAALRPGVAREEIERRQRETEDALSVLLAKGSPPLQGLHDIGAPVKRALHAASLNCRELLQIASFLRAVEGMKKFVPEAGPGENLAYAAMEALIPVPALRRRLEQAILSEEEVADSASAELGALRRKMRRAHEGIQTALEGILRSQGKALQERLITQRSGRYVLPVKAECRGQVPGVVHDASGSGATLFVEPMAVVKANNQIRELAAAEREEIERVLAAFSAEVAAEAAALEADAEGLAWLDFTFAKASLARRMRAVRPRFADGGEDEGEVELIKARHPLIPDAQVVPIDLRIGGRYRTLVVTGPNTGGKTVALKTLGLLCLMGQAGLHIPAAEPSRLTVFAQVLADIGDEQSIEQNLSTFSAHMRHLVEISAAVDEKSLVLVDELCSGTDPSEGAALAVALLDFFARRGAVTMATTHYKELKAYAIETPGVENACCEFDTATLRPTYRLLIGVPGVSNAFVISRKLGLDARIIAAAQEQIDRGGLRFEDLIREIEQNKTRALREREQAERDRAAYERELGALRAEQERLRESKASILAAARESSRQELEEELAIIDAYLAEIKQLMREQRPEEAGRVAQSLRQSVKRRHAEVEGEIGRATLGARAGDPALRVEAGGYYYAPALNLVGKALAAPDGKGMVSLQSGALKIQVKAASLLDADRAPKALQDRLPQQSKRPHQQVVSQRRMNFQAELKLLGQTADEAVANLDRFLDDAVLASASPLRIVHGKGTGVLRKAVADFLKRDSRVKSSRLAAYGEGDSGVTVVELR